MHLCHPSNCLQRPFLFRDRFDMEADLESTKGPFFQLESEFDPVVIAARRSSLSPAHYIEERAQTVATDELPLLSHSAQKEIVIMALGKTGDGKSSLLNDMLGKQVFKHRRAVQVQCDSSLVKYMNKLRIYNGKCSRKPLKFRKHPVSGHR